MNEKTLALLKKRETQIQVGFIIEVLLFFFSGYAMKNAFWLGILLFACALWVALSVGERIEKLGVFKFKWGLNEK